MNVTAVKRLGACDDALAWLREQDSAEQAWKDCQRGDWMLWILGRLNTSAPWSDERKPLLACSLDCALTVKHLWPAKQKKRIAGAVAVLRKWIKGRATKEQAIEARRELYASDASDAAYASAASAAAAEAASEVADDASDASAAADYAAASAAAYAAAAAASDARTKVLARCADIVRKHYPKPPQVAKSEAA